MQLSRRGEYLISLFNFVSLWRSDLDLHLVICAFSLFISYVSSCLDVIDCVRLQWDESK